MRNAVVVAISQSREWLARGEDEKYWGISLVWVFSKLMKVFFG